MLRLQYVALAAMVAGVSACSGSSSSPSANPATAPASAGAVPAKGAIDERAVAAVDAFGAHARSVVAENFTEVASSLARRSPFIARNACSHGVEFFIPDRSGDANSSETIYFYDERCTQRAIDLVRVYTPGIANSETVTDAAKAYAHGSQSAAPRATLTAREQISNATFDANGFPIVADGFNSSTTSQLSLGNTNTIDAGDEVVMLPSLEATSNFCGDFAGYDVPGIAALDATFGVEGTSNGATRTTNDDGSVTWAATVTGNVVQGTVGSLSIATGAANTACPISTPQFTLAGGSSLGSFSVPLTLRFDGGLLSDAAVNGATLPNGLMLTVKSSEHKRSWNPNFIRGFVSNGSQEVAKFGLDAFGNGHLIVTGSGTEFKVVNWAVVQ